MNKRITRVYKNAVKKAIRDNGKWEGYIALNKVNSFHIRGGWYLGRFVTITSLPELESTIKDFIYWQKMQSCVPELGIYAAFWEEK